MDGMNDMMAPEDLAPAAAETNTKGAPAGAQRIPIDSLAMPDEGEQMANPEVGDLVQYNVEGKVVSIEGGVAVVQPERINGQEIEPEAEASAEAEGPAAPDEYADLQAMAGRQGAL